MNITIRHVIVFENSPHCEMGPALAAALRALDHKLDIVLAREAKIMSDLTGLTQEVTDTAGVIDSAVVLINGLGAAIAAAGTDPVKLQALQDKLANERGALAAAIAANPVT